MNKVIDKTSIYTYAEIKKLTPKAMFTLQKNCKNNNTAFFEYTESLKNIVKGKEKLANQAEIIRKFLSVLFKSTKKVFGQYDAIFINYALYIYNLAFDVFLDDFIRTNPLDKEIPYLTNISDYQLMLNTIKSSAYPSEKRLNDPKTNVYCLHEFKKEIYYRQDEFRELIEMFEMYYDLLNNGIVSKQRFFYEKMQEKGEKLNVPIGILTGTYLSPPNAKYRGYKLSEFLKAYLVQGQSYFDYFNRRQLSSKDFYLLSNTSPDLKGVSYNVPYQNNDIDFAQALKTLKYDSFEAFIRNNFDDITEDEIQEIILYIKKTRVPFVGAIQKYKQLSNDSRSKAEYTPGHTLLSRLNIFNHYMEELEGTDNINLERRNTMRENLANDGYNLISHTEILLDLLEEVKLGYYDTNNLMLFANITSHLRRVKSCLDYIKNKEIFLYFQYGLYVLNECLGACKDAIEKHINSGENKAINRDKFKLICQISSLANKSATKPLSEQVFKLFEDNKENIFTGFKEYMVEEDIMSFATRNAQEIYEITNKYTDETINTINHYIRDKIVEKQDEQGIENSYISRLFNLDDALISKFLSGKADVQLQRIYYINLLTLTFCVSVFEVLPTDIFTDKDRNIKRYAEENGLL